MFEKLNILIADDKKEICDSIENNIYIELEKYNLNSDYVNIQKAFTEHAYDHGSSFIKDGSFKPDVCIFDLVFNGYTGIDLYRVIRQYLPGKKINLCIYTGVEKKYNKRKEAEILASELNGLINIIPKPNIDELLIWFDGIIEQHFNVNKKVEENNPFDLL